jgi:DNA-binding beta-propeller fold protein YncE
MLRFSRALALVSLTLWLVPHEVGAWERGEVKTFAVLPEGSAGPEGLEVDAASGNVYVTTFGFTSSGAATGLGQLFVYDAHGRLLRQLSIAGSSPHLLGVRVHPMTGALLVNDFGAGQVLVVNPHTGASKPFITLPALPHPGGSGLNDITFDKAGNVYVSDSFQGIIWVTPPSGGIATVWMDDALLRTAGVPPFGANGLRFNKHQDAMFVANTGDDTIIKIPVTGTTPGTPAVFANSVNGADGLIIDDEDNLWVAANQGDEIVVIDPTGKAIAKLGDFGGVTRSGKPIQMLFPASLRFSGKHLLVTNLALDLRLFSPTYVSVDSEWCAMVSHYTVVKLRARIPPVPGTPDDEHDKDYGHDDD